MVCAEESAFFSAHRQPAAPACAYNIIAIKVQAVHGGVSPRTGLLPPNVMFASNFERKHL
jgi:hypothetical protein